MLPAFRACAVLVVLVSTVVPAGAGQAPSGTQGTAIIRGTVLDAANGDRSADASVQLQEAGQKVKTDDSGRFELAGVNPGRQIVYVSVVGFILVKRTVQVAAGETLDLTIALTEGTGTYTEEVTVTAGRFREQEKAVPAQQTLGSADIQNLRNLLTNDPMRAIQVLPGVTTGDDFRSEFAVRGSTFSRLNFTFDGIPSTFLLHTVQQVRGRRVDRDGERRHPRRYHAAERIVPATVWQSPRRRGGLSDARRVARSRADCGIGVSGTDFSLVTEGPLGGSKAGSWLFSVRKSYLEMLLKQISDDNDFGFGFTDAQSKLVYDVSPRHRLELSLVAGRSGLDQTATVEEVNQTKDGKNAAQLASLAWRFTPSRSLVVTQRVAIAANQFRNTNAAGTELASGDGQDVTWRADPGRHAIAGADVRRRQPGPMAGASGTSHVFGDPRVPDGLVQSVRRQRAVGVVYGLTRWSPSDRVTVTPGARVDRWSLTGQTTGSPWVQAELHLTDSLKLGPVPGCIVSFRDSRRCPGCARDRRCDRSAPFTPTSAWNGCSGAPRDCR